LIGVTARAGRLRLARTLWVGMMISHRVGEIASFDLEAKSCEYSQLENVAELT